jgi:molybdenum cofactor cytidylyltransferase
MGTPKALLDYGGETFLDRLARILGQCADPVIVVLGRDAAGIAAGARCRDAVALVANPDPDRGMLSSLQCALAALPPDADAAMFTPVDLPAIEGATVVRLAREFAASGAPVASPVYRGRRGHPVCVGRAVIAELLALPVTAQARDAIRRYDDRALAVEVDDPGVLRDVDDPEAYRRLLEGAAP